MDLLNNINTELDKQKAFDTVDHQKCMSIREITNGVTEYYLHNRTV